MVRIRRVRDLPLELQNPRIRIGHNQGPPLDPGASWRRYVWSKARDKAWENPPIEVVRRRLKRAKALGLTYKQYTALLLDGRKLPE